MYFYIIKIPFSPILISSIVARNDRHAPTKSTTQLQNRVHVAHTRGRIE